MTKSENAEILQYARSLIALESAWTKRTWARDSYGGVVECCGPEAVQWCAVGAVLRAVTDLGVPVEYGYEQTQACWNYLTTAAAELGGVGDVTQYNDARARTHTDIMALYDRAIEMAL